jgi:hypothetical protein
MKANIKRRIKMLRNFNLAYIARFDLFTEDEKQMTKEPKAASVDENYKKSIVQMLKNEIN